MLNPESKALPQPAKGATLTIRGIALALLLFIEKSLLNFLVDFDGAQAAHGIGDVIRHVQHFGLRFAVTLALALALFCYVTESRRLAEINLAARQAPVRFGWLALHLLCVIAVTPLVASFYQRDSASLGFSLQAAACLVLIVVGVLALFAAAAPWAIWRAAAQSLGIVWLYAISAAAAATWAIQWSQGLWGPTAQVTFELVRRLLDPLIPSLQSDTTTRIIATDRFAVQVSEVCSGLEGMGLMLAFCSAWLIYLRREYVFPRALLIIPIGLLIVFVLNVLRIALLVLLGHVGFPEIASIGFHSQAGWIAFNAAACGIAFFSRRSAWLTRVPTVSEQAAPGNPTAAYLMPFLGLLAAGMISKAASGEFETFYWLRLIVAGSALIVYWPRLTRLDWRFTWRGPLLGCLIFGIWTLAEWTVSAPVAMPESLAAASPGARVLWLTIRVATGAVLVPVVEELAFRGYLLRRLVAEDFEAVSFATVGVWPLLISSVAFGVGHGYLWLPGIVAGMVYASVARRTGRFGEAVAAHATTNALLAIGVLVFGHWENW
ncbi:MAG TPA: exosortase E/protease, VPEID-CTERM system [Steroidobacteraceae bacterium]|nr:exosortase E/protease, VPEID-CTERM system [Steroidobacteraceae bacterium]